MKAVIQDNYGAFEEVLSVRDVEVPAPQRGEVLVRVKAASVHADVWHVITGRPYAMRLFGSGLSRPKKLIPGTDLSGVVEALGPEVTRFGLGDEVFGESHGGMQWSNGGAFAEYAAVPETALAHKPPLVTFEMAACVPSSGYIALMNLGEAQLKAGQRILINGAGGGVGSLAVQIAKAQGAHVTAVDCAEKLNLLRELGADETIDYEQQDFTRGEQKYDVILDVASNLTLNNCKLALTPEGKYIRIGHEHYGRRGGPWLGSLPQFFGFVFLAPFTKQFPDLNFHIPAKDELMKELARLLGSGQLTPRVDRIYPLEQAAAALRYLEQGQAHGKILLSPLLNAPATT